jgi:2-C-methyl-D-erythritol 4-phosphate cytidylyltransferase/2-C-methyl-D-erythritol 2,4-cyclodiphosphate synthase
MTQVRAFADAIVVAAGSSSRMAGIDKLDVLIAGRSLVRWAVDAVASAGSVRSVTLVTAASRVDELNEAAWVREQGIRVVAGGSRRQDSVAAGVRVAEADVVLVHDGARPLATPRLVDAVAEAARTHGAAVPVLAVADALKRVEGSTVQAHPDRAGLYRAQTPQGARTELLRRALELADQAHEAFGDEAELLGRQGVPVVTVPGEPANLKVTEPADLDLVLALAGDGTRSVRTAMGVDSHPYGPLDGLRLGGIDVPEAPRLYGHSDGDVALHALCDALLGAAGLGDLGRLFPAGDPATRGIDSRRLVEVVVERARSAGWQPVSADLTIVGARPRLGAARIERMQHAIAGLMGLGPDAVSVKAGTGNLSHDEGAGRTISATAVVGVARR